MYGTEMKGCGMTKLDEILQKIDIMNDRLFVGNDSFQNRMTVLEQSVKNCQKASVDRNDKYSNTKLAAFTAIISGIVAWVTSWLKG